MIIIVHQHQLIQRKENQLQGKNIPTMQRKGLGFQTGGPLQFSWGNEPSQLKKGEEELSQMKPIQKKSSGGEKMPEHINSKMSNAFGHDFSNVNIHNNSSSAKDVGALAYAQGNDVHFAPGQMKFDTQQGQELLGHELTHVVQQREGRVKPTTQAKGMAVNDDKGLEKEADDMGKKAAQGKTIQQKKSSNVNSQKFLGNSNPIQRYVKKRGKQARTDGYNRVSNDGKLAIKSKDYKGRVGFAEDTMIDKANSILTGLHSIAKVKKVGTQIKVQVPNDEEKENTLSKFTLVNRSDDKELSLMDDCGGANQEIMGANYHGKVAFEAEYISGGATKKTSDTGYQNAENGKLSTTEDLSAEIYIDIMKTEFNETLNETGAVKKWFKLKKKKRRELSEKYGINQYAVPKMGQSITIGSERSAYPNSTDKGYNFHFGFNLMASGDDYIALEDIAKSGESYYLKMYGPASEGQSWHEELQDIMDYKTTSMVVGHPDNK